MPTVRRQPFLERQKVGPGEQQDVVSGDRVSYSQRMLLPPCGPPGTPTQWTLRQTVFPEMDTAILQSLVLFQNLAIAPTKRWSLFPLPLRLRGKFPCGCLKEQTAVEVTGVLLRLGHEQGCGFCPPLSRMLH